MSSGWRFHGNLVFRAMAIGKCVLQWFLLPMVSDVYSTRESRLLCSNPLHYPLKHLLFAVSRSIAFVRYSPRFQQIPSAWNYPSIPYSILYTPSASCIHLSTAPARSLPLAGVLLRTTASVLITKTTTQLTTTSYLAFALFSCPAMASVHP